MRSRTRVIHRPFEDQHRHAYYLCRSRFYSRRLVAPWVNHILGSSRISRFPTTENALDYPMPWLPEVIRNSTASEILIALQEYRFRRRRRSVTNTGAVTEFAITKSVRHRLDDLTSNDLDFPGPARAHDVRRRIERGVAGPTRIQETMFWDVAFPKSWFTK